MNVDNNADGYADVSDICGELYGEAAKCNKYMGNSGNYTVSVVFLGQVDFYFHQRLFLTPEKNNPLFTSFSQLIKNHRKRKFVISSRTFFPTLTTSTVRYISNPRRGG